MSLGDKVGFRIRTIDMDTFYPNFPCPHVSIWVNITQVDHPPFEKGFKLKVIGRFDQRHSFCISNPGYGYYGKEKRKVLE